MNLFNEPPEVQATDKEIQAKNEIKPKLVEMLHLKATVEAALGKEIEQATNTEIGKTIKEIIADTKGDL